MHYANEERVNYRPPPTPPSMVNANREGIKDLEEDFLLDTVMNYRPPPKLPPKLLFI